MEGIQLCDSDDIQCSPDDSLIDKLTRFIV